MTNPNLSLGDYAAVRGAMVAPPTASVKVIHETSPGSAEVRVYGFPKWPEARVEVSLPSGVAATLDINLPAIEQPTDGHPAVTAMQLASFIGAAELYHAQRQAR